MKKIFLLITFIVFCCTSKAGTPVLRSQLVGKWRLIDENYKDCIETWEFSEDAMTQSCEFKLINDISTYSRPYYLFTGIPSKYVPSLIGQTKSGTHIIYYTEKRKIIQYYEVMSLKNDTLTLRYYADDAIGWSAGYVVLTFRRVKE